MCMYNAVALAGNRQLVNRHALTVNVSPFAACYCVKSEIIASKHYLFYAPYRTIAAKNVKQLCPIFSVKSTTFTGLCPSVVSAWLTPMSMQQVSFPSVHTLVCWTPLHHLRILTVWYHICYRLSTCSSTCSTSLHSVISLLQQENSTTVDSQVACVVVL